MSEQGITQDDERWIAQRMCAHESMADDLQAAIARGYERGRGESRDEIGNAVAILDEAGVECEDEIGERTLAGRVAALHRDRDRLAKRCEEFGQALDASNRKLGPLLREAAKRGDDPNADRLAALEQRVGGIVETLWAEPDTETAEYRRRLAALRSPAPEVDGLRAQVAAAERSEDRLTREVLTARRERDEARASMQHEAAIAIRIMQERDAAMEALHGTAPQLDGEQRPTPCWCPTLRFPGQGHTAACTRARALVAGKPVADPRDAEIETLRAKLAEAERCAQESADIMRRARDRAESYCLRLGEAESQRDAFRAHAIKLDALCVRAANLLRDWCGTEPRALAEDIRARGEVPR